MKARRNGISMITASMHHNATAEMAPRYREIIITDAKTHDKVVIDVKENESRERPMIRAIALVRYMGKGTEGLQKICVEIEVENKGVTIPSQVWWLENPHPIRETRQNGDIAKSFVVFVAQGIDGAKDLDKNRIKAAGVWYQVQMSIRVCPGSRYERCCGWGHIENNCGSKPTCGYCSGHHRTRDHECIMAGCTAKQGSLWSHTLKKCPN